MSYVTYTPSGPWVNNSPPGISAAVLSAVETFLVAGWFDSAFTSDGSGNLTANSYISAFNKLNPAGVVLNGGTSGTATLYQTQRGTWKHCLVVLNNFRTAGAAQTIAIPVVYTTAARIITGEIGTSGVTSGISLLASASAVNIRVMSTLNAASGSSFSTVTVMYQGTYGDVTTAFDTLQFQASGTAAHTGVIVIEGI